jgi:transcriptional antiterminator
MAKDPKQLELFKAETTWFHVFRSMVENGDVAKMGTPAVVVYLVIKAHTNYATGRTFPSVETIAEKAGISTRQVIRSLKVLQEFEYITKERKGRSNLYTLRERIDLKDEDGQQAAVASWDYLPSTVSQARTELKRFMLTGEKEGNIINIEHLNINIAQDNAQQININNANLDHIQDKDLKKAFERMNKTMAERDKE